jgi:GNAT superfamily N-acetyltransferase
MWSDSGIACSRRFEPRVGQIRPMTRAVKTHELRMGSRELFRPRWSDLPGIEVRRIGPPPQPHYARFLYLAVGGSWFWVERSGWTRERWKAHLETSGVQLWVGYLNGAPFGFHELNFRQDGSVLIAYFGLFQDFIGTGCGAHLLSDAIRRCWDSHATRIHVYTCELDHPNALPNYLARGFDLHATWTEARQLPVRPPDFWAGVDH